MGDLTRRSILCVESDVDSREALRRELHGYECTFACNAYEAMREFHARAFDAFVLDYWIPDLAGHRLCREIRKSDPNSPVLFCAKASEAYQGRALRAGADAYLRKPVVGEALRAKLAMLLTRADVDSSRAADEAERVLQHEIDRRTAASKDAAQGTVTAIASTRRSIERTARARAYDAFLSSGGTRAHFERWWPVAFEPRMAERALA